MYGTPVLGAEIGGIPELIKTGETGELFESGNAQQLERMIESMISDKAKLKAYSENCANVKFDTTEEYFEKLIKLYE